jgi:hypothetical protein
MIPPMGIQANGKIHAIFDAKQISERFTKREFVLELADNPQYPQFVLFQITGDRCNRLDDFQAGDEVQVEFSLRGREWQSPQGETRFFNSLDVWTIDRAGASSSPGQEEPPLPDGPPGGMEGDIPF